MPGRWIELLDDTSGRKYYVSLLTGTSSWKRPSSVPSFRRIRSKLRCPAGSVFGFDESTAAFFTYNTATHDITWIDDISSECDDGSALDSAAFPENTSLFSSDSLTATLLSDSAPTTSSELYGSTSSFVVFTRNTETAPESPDGAAEGEQSPRQATHLLPVDIRAPHAHGGHSSKYTSLQALSPWILDKGSSPTTPDTPLTQFDDHWGDIQSHMPTPLPPPFTLDTVTVSGSAMPSTIALSDPSDAVAPKHIDRRLSVDGCWEAQVDATTGRPFYFHYPTSTSTWKAPKGVEFVSSSGVWRSFDAAANVGKPPVIIDAARNVLHDALGEWPPKSSSLADVMAAVRELRWNQCVVHCAVSAPGMPFVCRRFVVWFGCCDLKWPCAHCELRSRGIRCDHRTDCVLQVMQRSADAVTHNKPKGPSHSPVKTHAAVQSLAAMRVKKPIKQTKGQPRS